MMIAGLLGLAAAVAAQAAGDGKLTNDRRLSAATQLSLARAAITACAARGSRVAVAVATPDGIVRTLLAADGVSRLAIETAQRKAVTADLIGFNTSGLTKATVEAPSYVAMLRSVEPTLVTIGGGVPIRINGVPVGSIGVGGASGPDVDEACATQAIEAEFGRAR